MADDSLRFDDLFSKGLEKDIDDLNKSLQDLNGTINNELLKSSSKLNKEADELANKFEKVEVNTEESQKAVKEYAAQANKLTKDQKMLNTAFEKYEKVTDDSRRSVDLLKQEAKQLATAYDKVNKETKDGIRQAQKLENSQVQLRKKIQQTNNELKQQKQGLAGIADRAEGLESGLSNVTGLIAGLGPAGRIAAIAIGALTLGFTALNDIVKETNKTLIQTQQITGATGGELADIVSGVEAFSQVFETDTAESIQAVNTLIRTFGIEGSEAIELVERALIRGVNINGDFLDQVREYSVQFRDANLTAEDLINTIGAGVTQGIFSDKAADTVKEFGLRFRELTKATNEALQPLSNYQEILEAQRAGDTAEGLRLVTQALREQNLTAQQSQTIIADVFGGPGEDVGKDFLFTLGEIVKSGEFLNRELSDAELNQFQLLQVIKQTELAQANLADEFEGFFSFFDKLGAQIKRNFFQGLLFAKQFFDGVFTGFVEIGKLARQTLPQIGKLIRDAFSFKGINAEAVAFFQNEFPDLVDAGLQEILKSVTNLSDETGDSIGKSVQRTAKATEEIVEITAKRIEEIGELTSKGLEERENETVKNFDEFAKDRIQQSKELAAKLLEEEKRLSAERTRAVAEFEDFRKMRAVETVDALIGLGDTLFGRQVEQAEERLARLQEDNEAELLLAGDNQQAQAAIVQKQQEEEAAAIRDINEKKRQQAVFQKAVDSADIIASTAKGIAVASANYAAVPFLAPLLPGVIGLITATGAAQLATVLATPIPAFAKGTDSAPGGLALVGEKGREMIVTPSGDVHLTPDKTTLTTLEKGSKVLTAQETNDALRAFEDAGMRVAYKKEIEAITPRDINHLGDKLETAFKKQTNHITKLNKGEVEYFIEHNGSITKYFGKRYG